MDAMLYITIPLFLIFIATVAFFEIKRKTTAFTISMPGFAYASLFFSSVFMVVTTYGIAKRNISFKNHYGFQDDSISNIISLIISFLFIVISVILLVRFFKRYNDANKYADQILCNSHRVYKSGAKDYKKIIISLTDNAFGFGIFGIIKGEDSLINKCAANLLYVSNRFSDSDIPIKYEYMREFIMLTTQTIYIPSAYNKTMTQEEFDLFLYTEKNITEEGRIKQIFPTNIFSFHKELIETSDNKSLLQIESNFIEQTISYFSYHYKFKDFNQKEFLKISEEELKSIEKSDRDKHLVSEYFNLLSSNNNVSQYHTNNNLDKEIDE